MQEQAEVVTMAGKPLTLAGEKVVVGDPAPDFIVISNDLQPIRFSSYRGKKCIISSVPSLDTPVCDMETRKFNEKAANLDSDIALLTISMDLPFAQKRWCAAAGIDRVETFSDHRDASFGLAYGVLIKELRLLARAVFLVDGEGTLRYQQLVKEIGDEPDYDAVFRALQDL